MKKKIIVAVASVLVFLIAFFALQQLLIPKNVNYPMLEGRIIGEYYDHTGGHDVLFLGDCEVYENIAPAVLWEKYGITSYVRGSPQQLVWQSYYLLKETLKYEKPRAVVFNVYALKYGSPQDEERNRMTFDTMKWSWTKVEAINASMTEDESFLDYVFPFLRYHSRITELTADDFKYFFKAPAPVTDCGYLMYTDVNPKPDNYGKIERPDSYHIPQTAFDYLDKMVALCEENDIELILVKAPTQTEDFWWFDEWEEEIVEYKNEKGIAYYNFIDKCDEIGIDWETDTYDFGKHLNVYGAEKYTDYLGSILASDAHKIPSRKDDNAVSKIWNGYLDAYNIRKESMEKEGEK